MKTFRFRNLFVTRLHVVCYILDLILHSQGWIPLLVNIVIFFINDTRMQSLRIDQGVWLDENNMNDKLFYSAQGQANNTQVLS